MYTIGARVRVKECYPYYSSHPEERDVKIRGELGTVVEDYITGEFISVLLDINSSNKDAYGYFFQQELEVV